MAQDPNQQSQYNRGYGGYASQPDDNTYDASSQYGQPSDYQQGSQYQGSYQQSAYGQQQQQQQQQYGPYQPPLSAARGASAHDPTSTGLSARNEAVFSYVLGWLSGLVF